MDAAQPPRTGAGGGVLLPWRTLPFPVDWDRVFGAREGGSPRDDHATVSGAAFGAAHGSRPGTARSERGALHLEVGFGDARYTVRRALAAPLDRFVGLEIASGSVQRGLRRVKREGPTNLLLAKAEAAFALRQLFAPHSLSSIVVNFPDPWPKERHVQHRLLQAAFFRLAASRLEPGGSLRLATDHPGYLAFALAEAATTGLFAAEVLPLPEDVAQTKYALKWSAQGIPLHYVAFRYEGAATPAFEALERPTTMPHSLFEGTLPASAPFTKTVLAYAEGHVVLHEVAASFGGESEVEVEGREEGGAAGERRRWLVRATVDEPDLKQQVLVLVQQRKPDEVIVRLETFGDPIITPTVRGAVHAVSEWLAGATGLRVTRRDY